MRGQALREGHRYARERRGQPFTGSMEAVATVVAGRSDDFEVRLWAENGELCHRCACPSWRDPCKHAVAATLDLRAWLDQGAVLDEPPADPDAARVAAVEERKRSARAEKLVVRLGKPPYVEVGSASGFVYRVRVRGGAEGPHSCDCPDFEANRLHTCKHVERDHFVRAEGRKTVVMYRNLAGLRTRLQPSFLRRRKEDVELQLPELLRSVSLVPMHDAVTGTYEEAVAQVARIASKKVILPRDLDRMQRLLVIARRCCNGPHMLGIDADDRKVPKLAELEQALRDLCLGEGRKAVVFSEWTDMTDRVEAMCARLGLHVFHLKGDVPVRARPALIRGFTELKGPAVFVSTDAGEADPLAARLRARGHVVVACQLAPRHARAVVDDDERRGGGVALDADPAGAGVERVGQDLREDRLLERARVGVTQVFEEVN